MYLAGEQARQLGQADYELIPTDFWTGPYGGEWPIAWNLTLKSANGASYQVVTAFDDQLVDGAVRYWEGLVNVFEAGQQVGQGYMELTGY